MNTQSAQAFAFPSAAQPDHWIGVASANHVARGLEGGFMQLCHGKCAPLRRMKPGDGVVYYSPVAVFGGREPCRMFTAIGRLREGDAYSFDLGGGFVPFRRDVAWFAARPAQILPLLEVLDLTRGKTNWGAPFRFGLVKIGAADFARIAEAMVCAGREI